MLIKNLGPRELNRIKKASKEVAGGGSVGATGPMGPPGPDGGTGPAGPAGPPGSAAASFETVSKNIEAEDSTLSYTGDNLTSITYASGVVKTLNYTGEELTTIVLSGSTPGGIELTKTLTYSSGNLTSIAYS